MYSLCRLWSSRNYEYRTLFRFQGIFFLVNFVVGISHCGAGCFESRHIGCLWESCESLQNCKLQVSVMPGQRIRTQAYTPGQSWHVEASDSSKNLMCKKENNKNHGAHKESMKSILKSQRIHSICGYLNLECLYEQPMVHQSIHLFFLKHLQVKLLRCQCQRPVWLRWAWPWHECVAAEAPGSIVAGGRCRKNSFKSLKMFEEIHVNAIQCLSFR